MAKRLGIDVDDEIVYRVKLQFQRHNDWFYDANIETRKNRRPRY